MLNRAIIILLITMPGHVMADKNIKWPKIESIPFTSGRPATEEDVSAGRAAFVLKSKGTPIGKAEKIEIPQYAYHIDEDTKEKTACVLIQAESAGENKYGGCVVVADGSFMVGVLSEFQLLGRSLKK